MVKGKKVNCPKCGKRFVSKNALTQHELASHVVAGGPKRRPARRAAPNRGGATTNRLSGSDMIHILDLKMNNSPGSGFVNTALGPEGLLGSRFHSHANLWARWRPVNMRLKIVGGGSATTFGTIAVGWSPDVNFIPSKAPSSTVNRVMALKPSTLIRVFETASITIPMETARKWYHCAGPPDESNHGAIVAVVASTTGGYQGKVNVSLHLSWDVEFQGAEMSPAYADAGKQIIKPDSGYSHLFTTSDSSWDSDKLTFKMHSGGGMVPFSTSRLNYIYTPQIGQEIKYLDSTGKAHDVLYAVRIQNYDTSAGLAFCSTVADAKAYILTGDSAKLLNYYKAGPFCVPDILIFEGVPAADAKATFSEVDDLREQVATLTAKLQLAEQGFSLIPDRVQ